MTMTRLTTTAMTGRRMKMSVNLMARSSVLGRPRRELRLRRERVVHGHRDAVPHLEGAAGHHRLSGLQAGDDLDEVAAPLAEAHELLPGDRRRLAGGVLLPLDREHRVAVRRVE